MHNELDDPNQENETNRNMEARNFKSEVSEQFEKLLKKLRSQEMTQVVMSGELERRKKGDEKVKWNDHGK